MTDRFSERVSPELARQVNRKLVERGRPPCYDEATGEKLKVAPSTTRSAPRRTASAKSDCHCASYRAQIRERDKEIRRLKARLAAHERQSPAPPAPPQPERKPRPCRKCTQVFTPKGPGEQVCKPCKRAAGKRQAEAVFGPIGEGR